MNTSTIMEMIKADPSIADDPQAFITRMNEKNIRQVRNVQMVTSAEEYFTSIAEQNGGEATTKDVQYALELINKEPLLQELDDRYDKAQAAIINGEVSELPDLINVLSE